jgi:hypothetical protein
MIADLLTFSTWATKQGWYVAPVKEKVSYVWHTQASRSGADLWEWFGPDSKANYTGYVVCLKKSQLMVVDVDSEDEPLPGPLDETFTVQTSEEYKLHFYYEDPEGLSKYLPAGGKWGQYKGAHGSKGGYVIGPGSLHPSGATYTPLLGTRRSVAMMPQWTRELALARREETKKKASPLMRGIPPGLEEFVTEEWVQEELYRELELLAAIQLGYRNTESLPILAGIARLCNLAPDILSVAEAWKFICKVTEPSSRKRDPQHWHMASLRKRWSYVLQTERKKTNASQF